MPLSRLSPRRGRNTLARPKSARAKQDDHQRHMHLWAAIRATRVELEQWERQLEQVNTLFSRHIAPRERQLTSAVSSITGQLINHFADSELGIPDRSLLGLWVTENLNALHDHPFSDSDHIHKLSKQWLDLLNHDGPIENQLSRLASQQDFSSGHSVNSARQSAHGSKSAREQGSAEEASSGQPYVEPQEKDRPDNTTDADARYAADATGSAGESQPDIAETVSSLEEKLSVERLFRQLARVLHPDREQDEQVKAEKNVLMSACLKARQENDINALLTLYCEHVGELPDDLHDNSHAELIKALETQLRELQRELRDKRFGDPLHSQIIERYNASSSEECESSIRRHSTSLDREITSAQKLMAQLADQEGLMDALDERRAVEQDRMSINELTGY